MTTSSDPTSKAPARPFDNGLVLGEGFAMICVGFAGIPIGWVAGSCLYGLVRSRAQGFSRRRELIAALWTANAALVVLWLPLLPVVAISLGLVIQALGLTR